ncbi:MAG: hypothetical protein J7483_11135 [Novosphingobium sp.]|nr:hypothetical protein [Novosphingobium sp.]
MLFLAIALASATADLAAPLPPLFLNEQDALRFSATFGPKWRHPRDVKLNLSGTLDGFQMKQFEYLVDGLQAFVTIGTGPTGKIGYYDVRFPSIGTKCITPDPKSMAQALLNKFEPDHSFDIRNVNHIASVADLIWPNNHINSGPAALVGNTMFQSFKMMGYCRIRVTRRPAVAT